MSGDCKECNCIQRPDT